MAVSLFVVCLRFVCGLLYTMFKKDKNQSRDVQKTNERLYYKFIAAYVEGKYKEVYEDADRLYVQAKRDNPRVRDLTKTTTFIQHVYPGAPIPRYYVTRNVRTPPPPPPHTQPQFMLNIPLVPLHELVHSTHPEPEVCTQSTPPEPEACTPTEPEVCTQSTPPEPEACTLTEPEVRTQFTPPEPEACTPPEPEACTPTEPEVCTQSTPPEPEACTPTEPEVCTQSTPPEPEACTPTEPEVCTQSTPQLFLAPELYDEVVKDLNKDPEIWNYLNDISMEDDMNDTVVEDIGDIVFDNILTPLEMEVAAIDY